MGLEGRVLLIPSGILTNLSLKTVVIFQVMVPIFIMTLLPFIPESPRWYIQHGRQVDRARASLRRVRETEQDVEDEILVIREALEFEKEAISNSYSALWKDRSVRKRLILAFILNIGQQLTGQGTLNTYSTAIYKKVFTSSSQIALINALNATFGILFTLNAVWTVDRFGRKALLIVGALGMSMCMLIVTLVGEKTPNLAGGSKSEPVGIAIVFLLFLFIFFYKPSVSNSGLCSYAPPSLSVSSYVLRFIPYAPQRGNNTPETFLNRK